MTATRLRLILSMLHWTQRGLAADLECSDRLVRMWAQADAAIPEDIADWLEALAALHTARPMRYRQRS